MSSISTINLVDRGQTSHVSETGLWCIDHEHQTEKSFNVFRAAKAAGFAVALAISPMTAMTDPWFLEKKQRDAVVTVTIYKEIIGRIISRAEALRIARQILEDAESERLELANFEAARGIMWADRP